MSTFFRGGERRGETGEERNLGTRFSTQTPREIPYSHLKITRRKGKKGTKTIKRFIQKLFKSGMFFFYLSPSLSPGHIPSYFFCEVRSPTSERSENERFNLSADSRDRLFRGDRKREREKTRVTGHEISTREIETRDHLTSKRRSTLSLTPFYICDVDGH